MRGLVFDGPGRVLHRDDLPDPNVQAPGDAIVGVGLAGLCGSDLHPYEGREPARPGVVAGHEAVAEVLATGSGVRGIRPGDRVLVPFTTSCGACPACQRRLTARCHRGQLFGWGHPDRPAEAALDGAQAQFVRVPLADTTLVPVPDAVDDPAALLLTDNLPTAWEAVERTGPVRDAPLAVVGLGAVGLCAVVAARALGVGPLLAIDPVPGRRARAQRLGADRSARPAEAVDALRGMLLDAAGEGAGAAEVGGAAGVVEAAGTDAAQRLAFELLRTGGTLSSIAVSTEPHLAVSPTELYDRNATVRMGRASVRATLERLLPRVVAGEVRVPTELVLGHLGVPLEEGPELYRRFAAREEGLVKAAFRP
jgi:alcohol dehydrogenase